MFDEGLHCARSIVSKNAFDLVKEPPFGCVRTEKPSGDSKDDEQGWGKRKCGKEPDARPSLSNGHPRIC
jgi:hypothetical protein